MNADQTGEEERPRIARMARIGREDDFGASVVGGAFSSTVTGAEVKPPAVKEHGRAKSAVVRG